MSKKIMLFAVVLGVATSQAWAAASDNKDCKEKCPKGKAGRKCKKNCDRKELEEKSKKA